MEPVCEEAQSSFEGSVVQLTVLESYYACENDPVTRKSQDLTNV